VASRRALQKTHAEFGVPGASRPTIAVSPASQYGRAMRAHTSFYLFYAKNILSRPQNCYIMKNRFRMGYAAPVNDGDITQKGEVKMDLKAMVKTVEKFVLRDPVSLDELHALMEQSKDKFPGKFKLKKGLFGASVAFDTYMQIQPRVKVKDNTVIVRKVQSSTKVGGIDIKATQQASQAAKSGGLGSVVTGGPEYFLKVCDAMRELLKSRMP